MVAKRPFQEEDLTELSFKQAKQLGFDKNLNSYIEDFPSQRTSPKPGFVESNVCKYQFDERQGNADINSCSNMVDKELEKELEICTPLSLVSNSSIDEDSVGEDKVYLPHFQGYFDLSLPRRLPVLFEDPYSFLLNCSPTKEVPVGPDHQADVPPWDPNSTKKSQNYSVDHENEEKLLGTCIIPMPDNRFPKVEQEYSQGICGCVDVESIKCVQQHVREAREKLRVEIGDENFAELGFLDMGEEVASKWSEEEEQIFHQVVYSNPVLLGKKFWAHLFVVFPTRTKKEIVSYYFNVFMLRRRALQNRSDLLAIDSDDDEWHAAGGGFYQVGEDEDSIVESFGDQDVHVGHLDDTLLANASRDEVEDSSNGVSDGNWEEKQGDAIELDGKRD